MHMGLLLVCVVLVEVDPAQNSCTPTPCSLAFRVYFGIHDSPRTDDVHSYNTFQHIQARLLTDKSPRCAYCLVHVLLMFMPH